MLPYQLRPPRYGNRAENSRRKNDLSSSDGGGPIQNAIKADLVELLTRVRDRIRARSAHQHRPHERQQDQQDQPECMFRRHWESGTAFGIFKGEFESAKAAVIHLLHPSRCDREAYSQLAYAACLDLLKESFAVFDGTRYQYAASDDDHNDDERTLKLYSTSSILNLVDDASFAVFSLFALFDTNPLPREIPSPLQLLPIGLRSFEDPRTLYRRFFSQNIRIDRLHFILLLRLRELARATQASCREALLDRCRLDLDRKEEQLATRHPEQTQQHQALPALDCKCGVSTDVLVVIERLFPVFDLCEYTGPVGLEALAGHGDFPPKKDPATFRHLQLARTEQVVMRHPQTFELSNDIDSLMKQYQGSIEAMHIPLGTSSFASTRLRESLQPFLSSVEKERWADTRSTLFPESYERRYATNTSLVRKSPDENERANPSPEKRDASEGIDLTVIQIEKNFETPIVVESDEYELVLRGIGDHNLKRHLETSLNFLLQRDQPIALSVIPQKLRSPESVSLLSAENDDFTIGNGGASLGIDEGRDAIRKLLLAAGQRDSNPALGANQLVQYSSEQSAANLFLTSNHEDVGQSDNESLGSEITTPSYSDIDDEQDDDLSVATSAVGRHALEVLLETVREGQLKEPLSNLRRREKRQHRKTMSTSERRTVRNATDGESCIEQGQAALSNLLGKAIAGKKSKCNSSVGRKTVWESRMDDNSTTSSVGRAAKRPRGLRSRAHVTTKTATLEFNGDDDGSFAGSIGPGARALKDLLYSCSSNNGSDIP
jgi:hypothetical protein